MTTNQYYDIAQDHPTLAAKWDSFHWLPEPGENLLFDKFCQTKHVSRDDLAAIGTKMTSTGELAWLFPGGVKYRKLTGERRAEGTLNRFKIIGGLHDRPRWAIVAEGETDAAALHRAAPDYAILVMPAGAKAVSEEMLRDLTGNKFERLFIALDADEAGDAGAAKMPGQRLRPPEPYADWAEALSVSEVADNFDPLCVAPGPLKTTFSFRELKDADLGTYSDNNWFDDGILPVRGEMIIHGEQKSLKSVVMMEIVRALSTGTPFAGYVNYLRDDPARVLVFQFEVKPSTFQDRVISIASSLSDVEMYDRFMDNAGVYKLADNEMPRLNANDTTFLDTVRRQAEQFEADVLCFDPFQRLSGAVNGNHAHEIGPLLDKFHILAEEGYTIVLCHHSSKSLDPRKSTSISGSQRFGADVDSICSLYHDPRVRVRDDNSDFIKQRNLIWTLRGGAASPRGVETRKDEMCPQLVLVSFCPQFTGEEETADEAPKF